MDFPGGLVIKNLPANAGDTGSIPGPGRSHMPVVPQAPSQCSRVCSATRDAIAMRVLSMEDREQPLLTAARECPRAVTKTLCNQK